MNITKATPGATTVLSEHGDTWSMRRILGMALYIIVLTAGVQLIVHGNGVWATVGVVLVGLFAARVYTLTHEGGTDGHI